MNHIGSSDPGSQVTTLAKLPDMNPFFKNVLVSESDPYMYATILTIFVYFQTSHQNEFHVIEVDCEHF